MRQVSEATTLVPYMVLGLALCGAALSLVRSIPIRLPGLLGFVLMTGTILFILQFGVWGGFANPADVSYMGIAGRIPQSDAGAHFLGSFDVGYGGRWAVIPSTRPLGAAFRDVITGLAGLSYPRGIVVQALALAAAMFFAARNIHRWLGPWSALAFTGFALILFRPFLGTSMSEPLGLFWSLLCVGFLADALRTRALPSALLAVSCMAAAQLTRSGAVLIVPALMLWVFVAFANRTNWLRVTAVIVLAAGAPLAFATLLGAAYGLPNVSGGWNSLLVLCGLVRGTDWLECANTVTAATGLSNSVNSNTAAFADAIFDLTRQSFLSNPTVALAGAWRSIHAYFTTAPAMMLDGHTRVIGIPAHIGAAIVAVTLPGLAVYLVRARATDWLLWALILLALAVSASLVFATAGWRVLYATHPVVALLLVIGLRSGAPSFAAPVNARAALATLGSIALAFLLAPLALHLAMAQPPRAEFLGRAVTGFTVVPEGATAPGPTLAASEFAKLVARTNLERDWGPFVAPTIAAAPVAMFWTVQIGVTPHPPIVYIGPAHILARPHVAEWRFTFREPEWKKKGQPVRVIEEATAVEAP